MSYELAKARRAIRAECTKQGIDDDTRRAMMLEHAGVSSSTELDADGARRVIKHLRKTGEKSALATRQAGEWAWVNNALEDKRRSLWKIRRLCINLGIAEGQQIVYAEGVAARIAGCERYLRMMTAGELWELIGPLERTTRYARKGGK